MKRAVIAALGAASLLAIGRRAALAQDPNVTLHVNPRWKSCAFQLDASLTQAAWHQFTQEAAPVTYFRSLTDARPMGAGNVEVSLLLWETGIDETTAAWNDTFVHPQADHWLTDGAPLPIPGLTVRGGITSKLDVGAYITTNPQSNYGLWGGQLQYNLVNDQRRQFATSARVSLVSLFGPEDLDLTVYGVDLVTSKTFTLANWVSVSPYAGGSTVLSRAHEKSAVVDLADESVLGLMGTVGAVVQLPVGRLAVEYTLASVNSLSFKVGAGF